MSELAFNMNGEPFDVPANATGWRVRRMKHKGAPEVVYGREGLPLILPIEADIDDLRREVGTTGRYRLDPVEGHRPIPNASSGYVFVHDEQPATVAATNSLPPPSDNIVIEAMRMNSEIARSVVDRFPQMLEAAATLLRAADGAGLPSRESRVNDEDGDDQEDREEGDAPAGFDLNALVAQVVPMLIAGLASGKVKMPGLASMFDWRKAAPASAAAKPVRQKSLHQTSDAVPEPINEDAHKSTQKHDDSALPSIDPETMAHFIAVQSALKPEEAELARSVAADLSPAQLRSWFDELKKLSVPQAVQKIRVLIAGNTEAVS